MIKKYHVSEQHGNTWNPKSYVKFISGTQTYNKFPITLRTTQQSIPTWSVKGNMVQNGVPSSTSPITPSECGERTGNLFPLDVNKLHVGRIENDGTIGYQVGTITVGTDSVSYQANVTWRGFYTDYIQASDSEKLVITPNISSTISWACNCYDTNDNFLGKAPASQTSTARIFTLLQGTVKIRINVTSSDLSYTITNPMLNTGSTPLPYQPYGYKLDIKSGNTTTPVYLGQVQSTRRIRKYEFTGQESFFTDKSTLYNNTLYFGTRTGFSVFGSNCASLNSHFYTAPKGDNPQSLKYECSGFNPASQYSDYYYIRINLDTIGVSPSAAVNELTTAFKTWLVTQYTAGTPVTVWYVLANETTGVVNEPLRKIGDYVDSITNPVSLPTVPGINTIDVNTTLKPSEMSLTYDGYKVCKSAKIQQVTREVDFVNNTKSLTGSVDNLKVYQLMNRCNVSDNGTITAYYGDPNYTEDGSNGQVMVYVRKFYYKLDVSQPGDLSGINIRKGRWSISDIPIEGYKLHPAFLAADGVTELPYFLYGAFDAVGQDSNGIYSSSYNTTSYKLSSVGGNTYKPICSLTRATARTMATNRGNGWYPVGVKQTMAIQMLFSVEFGFNSQIGVGRGIVKDTGTHNTGLTIGNKTSGTYDNATTAVNYRGIENLWGNICNFIDGINISNTTPYICNTFTFSDNTSTNYSRISFTLPGINYTTAFGYDSNNDWVLLPSETNRSTVDEFGPIGDYFGSNSDWRVARLGGSYIYGRDAGLFYWDCHYNSSYTDVGVGVRLMYIPQTT